MDIGLKHLFYAFALVWALHIGYVLNLSLRQKRLADELRSLKDSLKGKAGS
ncbi:MAG TPA: CcmD family protein [Candidatus Xenobia bacterium]|nr:CcmD family protein [Candidatus Xenobia bacterium]